MFSSRYVLPALLGCLAALAPPARAQVITPISASPLLADASSIHADGKTLYVTINRGSKRNGSAVVAVPIGGGTPVLLYPRVTPTPLSITSIGNDVYWIDPNSGPITDTQVLRAPKNGRGPVTPIYTGRTVGQPILDGSGITTDGTRLYTADEVDGKVHRMNADGSGLTRIGPRRYCCGFRAEHVNRIAWDDGMLYIVDAGKKGVIAPQLTTIAANGTGSTPFRPMHAGAPFVNPMSVTVGNGMVFVTDAAAGNTIWMLPVRGGKPVGLHNGKPFTGLRGITFHAGALYVADRVSTTLGRIFRIDLGVSIYGHGCPGTGGISPLLSMDGGIARRGNQRFGIAVDHGLGGAAALLLLGAGQDAAGLPIGGGCRIWLDLRRFVTTFPPARLSGKGAGAGSAVQALPLAADPKLLGVRAWFQWLVLDKGAGNGAFTLTGGGGIRIL